MNLAHSTSADSSPGLRDKSWALRHLGITACHAQGLTGQGVLIGHLDTGVAADHPDLCGKIAAFQFFDNDGDPVPGPDPLDTGSHGTATASLICGETTGTAPGARLCSAVVIDGGKCLVRVLCGLEWLLSFNIRVLSMSLGLPGENPLFSIILSRLRERGVLPVLPIGNTGVGWSCSPGNYADILAVGAVDAGGQVARFSGSQWFDRDENPCKPDVVAPGVEVRCASPDGGYQQCSGTSMASAYVAGIAALLFEALPGATVEQVETALRLSCEPHPDYRAGEGIVHAERALVYLQRLMTSPEGVRR